MSEQYFIIQGDDYPTMERNGKTYRIYGPDAPSVLRNVLDNLPEPVGFVRGDGEEANILAPQIGLKNMVDVLSACYDELISLGSQIEDGVAERLYPALIALRAYVEADYDVDKCRDILETYLFFG